VGSMVASGRTQGIGRCVARCGAEATGSSTHIYIDLERVARP
jgi:hypothetical protein